MVSLARWREAFRKLLEKYGLMLSPEQANRRKEMKLQQANRRKQMKLQKANRRKELKLLKENLKKFGLSMAYHNDVLDQASRLLANEIANCKKQGIQIPLMNLQNTVSLHFAIRRGDESYIRFLLHCGVDPNSKDSEGTVSLWEALRSDQQWLIRLLIDNGANLYSGDMGRFAWTVAGNQWMELFEYMVFYGGDITLPNINGKTALPRTVAARNFRMVQFLLHQGAAGPPGQNCSEYIHQQEVLKQKAVCKRPVSNEGTLVGKHVICTCKCSKPPLSSVGGLNVQNCGGVLQNL